MNPGQSLEDLGYVRPSQTDSDWEGPSQASGAAGPPATTLQPQISSFTSGHSTHSPGHSLKAAAASKGSSQQASTAQGGFGHAAPAAPENPSVVSGGWVDEDDEDQATQTALPRPTGKPTKYPLSSALRITEAITDQVHAGKSGGH